MFDLVCGIMNLINKKYFLNKMNNQKSKKNIVIILIVLILFVTAWLFMKKIKKDDTAKNQINQADNMFGSKKVDPKEIGNITGTVSNISEKTMTVKTDQGDIVVGISGTTGVIFNQETKLAQMADVKLNNLVSVQYNLNTKAVNLITILSKNK